MAKTLQLDAADAPPFPADAAWFLRRGQQVDSHEHRERRDRIDGLGNDPPRYLADGRG